MSKKKEKVPIVRFRDFSEPWLKTQLSEVAEFSKGKGYSKKDLQSHGTPIILYGRLYTNYESAISNIETYAKLEENSVISEGGEVIIPASGESADDISRASCVIDRGIILGGDLNIVRPHEYLNSLFIAITLSNGSQQRELSKRAQGKSVVHLHNSDLKAVKLFYPSYEEQSAIGSLFRTIDDLLASYKNNLANYQSLKATMLSKMYPKAGQTVPEIRLDGFERKWEKKKLIDLVSPVSRKVKKPSDPYYRLSIRSHAKGTFKQFVDDPKKIAMDNLFEVKENDLVVNITFAWEHAIAVASKEDDGLLVSHRFPTYVIDKSDKNFINIYIKREEFRQKMDLLSPGGAGRNRVLNVKDFINIQMTVPELEEQQSIGAYFSNLDNLIAAHQEKITQLETLKKKLLQDMFI